MLYYTLQCMSITCMYGKLFNAANESVLNYQLLELIPSFCLRGLNQLTQWWLITFLDL